MDMAILDMVMMKARSWQHHPGLGPVLRSVRELLQNQGHEGPVHPRLDPEESPRALEGVNPGPP